MKSRLARPMPCSPDSVPPSDSVSANTRASAACGAVALRGVGRVEQDVDVQVAVAGVAEADDRQREFARQRAARRRPGRDARNRHHHVLVDLARRQRAQRRRQRLARGPQRLASRASSAASSSETRPSPSAARISASMACGRVSRIAVGLDHQQRAGFGGRSAPPTSRARRTQSPSMNSSIDGVTGCAISRATARAALATSR